MSKMLQSIKMAVVAGGGRQVRGARGGWGESASPAASQSQF